MKKIAQLFLVIGLAACGNANETSSALAADQANPESASYSWGEYDDLHQRLLSNEDGMGLKEMEAMLSSNGYTLVRSQHTNTLPEGMNCHCNKGLLDITFSKHMDSAEEATSVYKMSVGYIEGHTGFDPNAPTLFSSLSLTYEVIRPLQ